jgi:hypothetical protein
MCEVVIVMTVWPEHDELFGCKEGRCAVTFTLAGVRQ